MKKYRVRNWIKNWLNTTTDPEIEKLTKKIADLNNSIKLRDENQYTVGTIGSSGYNFNTLNTAPQLSISTLNSLNSLSTSDVLDRERAVKFNIFKANGGRIIETQRTDKATNRTITGLYVISDEADLGREIDKIFTMEALK
jgi:hypothetical protein